MRRAPRMLACGLFALAAMAASAGEAQASAGELQLLSSQTLTPRLAQLTFATPALEGTTNVRVLLPSGYSTSGRARYPLLLLLHGANESSTAWTEKGGAEAITAAYPLIVVMPDGGVDGGYQNWYNGGAYGPPEWERYHIEQLLPWIDAHYRTIGRRAGRAVAGVSMGGGGAMHYAADHPELFVAAASFSGAVDNSNMYMQKIDDATGVVDGKPPGSACGLWETEQVRCRGVNATDLAENLAGLFLQVDSGNGLPGGPNGNPPDLVESNVHEQSVTFHERLDELGIEHLWDDYGPGGHEYFYFSRDLSQLLPRLTAVFAHPPAPPRPFSFTSIADDYNPYGWNVAIERTALEFSELSHAGPKGFEARGSGSVHVTTARYYSPGQTLLVEAHTLAGTTTQLLRADASGRLSLALELGPPNPYQEYSAQAEAWLATRNPTQTSGQSSSSPPGWPVYTATVAVRRVR